MKLFDLVHEEQKHTGDAGLTVDVGSWKASWGRQKADYEDGLQKTAPRAPTLRRGFTP